MDCQRRGLSGERGGSPNAADITIPRFHREPRSTEGFLRRWLSAGTKALGETFRLAATECPGLSAAAVLTTLKIAKIRSALRSNNIPRLIRRAEGRIKRACQHAVTHVADDKARRNLRAAIHGRGARCQAIPWASITETVRLRGTD